MRIIDFEQLKAENQSYADKIEERDEELTRLRAKCENSTQILAHLREKSASATLDMIDQQARMQEVEIECMEVCTKLCYLIMSLRCYKFSAFMILLFILSVV